MSLSLAEKVGYSKLDELKANHMRHLIQSGQYEKAGDIHENLGNSEKALEMYLKANRLMKVAQIMFSNNHLLSDGSLTANVLRKLVKQEMFDQAAEIYMRTSDPNRALDCYQKGKNWNKALDLARQISPDQVIDLEDRWGDHLCDQKQFDAAINHFIEAGSTIKALSAAVKARQWKKAIHIVDVVNNQEEALQYYGMIAEHLASIKDYKKAESMYMKASMYRNVVDMYNGAGQWERAHLVAADHLEADEVSEIFLREGRKLEGAERWREAEKLYLAMGAPDAAITMYKNIEQYDSMIRLVEQFHPDLLQTTHLHLAQQMEQQGIRVFSDSEPQAVRLLRTGCRVGKYRAAEIHYLAVNEWKAAMNMYRILNMWEEAYRVAKQSGGPVAGNQVAFLWSRTLPLESAIKLLTKFGILESSIDYACETYQYEFAFQLCKNIPSKKKEIHYSYALALEDDGKTQQAETEFVLAERPREAILMYMHAADWPNAMRVAEENLPDSLPEILRAQAAQRFSEGRHAEFETLLLRAQQPDAIVQKYKSSGMWSDALRVCREYLPQQLATLQQEYTAATGGGAGTIGGGGSSLIGTGGDHTIETLLTQANELVVGGMHKEAIGCLLQVNETLADASIVKRALLRASEMAGKFLYGDDAVEVYQALAPRLREMQEYKAAWQIYVQLGQHRDAVDTCMQADDWQSAVRIAREFDPSLRSYVEEQYKTKLADDKNIEQLADVDIIKALDMLAEQGQWTRLLEKARSNCSITVLHKYMAMYADQLLRDGFAVEALAVYHTNGTAPLSQYLIVYERIAIAVFSQNHEDNTYTVLKTLRQVLYDLVASIQTADGLDLKAKVHFNTILLITHYMATRAACKQIEILSDVGVKLSVALLRYTDILPADKAYYEAGVDLIAVGKLSEAFIFLNHYLDVCEAIEDEDSQLIDHTELTDTDFPANIPVPSSMYLKDNIAEHNRIREWVLTTSMDLKINQALPLDDRQMFESSLQPGQMPCLLTGYPVHGEDFVLFNRSPMTANRDAWKKTTMAEKMHPDSDVRDVLNFVKQWCGDPEM